MPLSHDHLADLQEPTADGYLHELWYTSVPDPDGMGDEITRRLGLQEQGSMLPFTVIQKSTGKAVGMTTYMDISTDDRHMEIGSTWYRQSFQRTAVNTETMFLLLRKAFEDLD